jgi:hypothetical protein
MAENCQSRCKLELSCLALECLVAKSVEHKELVGVAELECLVAKLVDQEDLVEVVGVE